VAGSIAERDLVFFLKQETWFFFLSRRPGVFLKQENRGVASKLVGLAADG
jgi:hypothetical protein